MKRSAEQPRGLEGLPHRLCQALMEGSTQAVLIANQDVFIALSAGQLDGAILCCDVQPPTRGSTTSCGRGQSYSSSQGAQTLTLDLQVYPTRIQP